jgi:hypothetical protein
MSSLESSIEKVEKFSFERDYAGFCKFDALNSPLLEKSFGFSRVSRLFITQVINRVPLPLRQWFGVPRKRNPLGVANFIEGYANDYETSRRRSSLEKLERLADWLLQNHSSANQAYTGPGLAFGYHFPWQSPGFLAPRYSPNCYVSSLCGKALLRAYSLTKEKRFLEATIGISDFILKGLPVLENSERGKCIAYVPAGTPWKVININAVAAGFLAQVANETKREELFREAHLLLSWVANAMNEDGSWNYTFPKSQSNLGPDNYHTGGILDGYFDYLVCREDKRFLSVFEKGIQFYQSQLFTAEAAPKWRVTRTFPIDIHGAAQGILTFTKASRWNANYLSFAKKISDWAVAQMQDPRDGHFYYQKYRWFTWKADFMRWSNSWMFHALSELKMNIKSRNQEAA